MRNPAWSALSQAIVQFVRVKKYRLRDNAIHANTDIIMMNNNAPQNAVMALRQSMNNVMMEMFNLVMVALTIVK